MNRTDILLDIGQTLGCPVEEIPGDLSDRELNRILGLAPGTAEVKRCKGSLPIPSYKVGRSRRTPLSAVIKFKLDQIADQTNVVDSQGGLTG